MVNRGSLLRFVLVLATTPGALGLVLMYTPGLSGKWDPGTRTGFLCTALAAHDCYDTSGSRRVLF
jgi:hypothetical protein